jgi:hypothetical protein
MPVQASTNEPSEGGQKPSPLSLIIEFISCAVLITVYSNIKGGAWAIAWLKVVTFAPSSRSANV